MRFLSIICCLLFANAWAQDDAANPRASLEEARTNERNILDQINQVDRSLSEIAAETNDLQQRI